MKPVYQTKDNPIDGNCLAASLASIFENDIESYPEILDEPYWLDQINDHLIEKQGYYIAILRSDEPENHIKGYHLVFGMNEKFQCSHCMVGLNGKTVFDPSKADNPLTDIQYGIIVKYFPEET